MLDNTSQLLLRHPILTPDSWLINANDALSHQAPGLPTLRAHFVYAHAAYRADDPMHTLAAELPSQTIPHAVVYVPKEKALLHMLMDNLAQYTTSGTTVHLVGHNKGGIKSVVKQLGEYWQQSEKLASGNHCLLYACTRSDQIAPPFTLINYRHSYRLAEYSNLEVFNLPGVFSEQKLDQGTQLLLDYLHQKPRPKSPQRVLDFACGTGVIGAYLRAHYPVAHLTACDISSLALNCSQHTLAAQPNTCDFELVASDGLQRIQHRYDWIVSNPPFHTGQKTDYSIAAQFFAAAKQRLHKNGRLTLVANSFLGYKDMLSPHFAKVEEVQNNNKFKIIEAWQPC